MPIRLTLVLALAVLPGASLGAQSDNQDSKPVILGRHPFQHQRLTESSALVVSGTQNGILWTLNDSDNPAELFATDTLGRDRGVVRVEGAENVDWEAMARARCGEAHCLYVADVGDNRERRASVQIYRIREPIAGRDSVVRPDAILNIRYPDRPHDVEAILVTPAQDVFLITKKAVDAPAVYRVRGSAWLQGKAEAELIQTLPIPTHRGGPYHVTDAAPSEDGKGVAVKTYQFIYFFRFDGEKLTPDGSRRRCDVTGLDPQGEGLAWLGGDTLATTSERVAFAGGGITRITCE